MDSYTTQQSLNTFIQNLKQQIKIDQIIMFGSQADKSASESSDIDIVVVSSDFNKLKEEQRFDLLYNASRYLYPEIHPWPSTRQELDKATTFSLLGTARRLGKIISTS